MIVVFPASFFDTKFFGGLRQIKINLRVKL
jgi:hypothetical protein